MMLKNSHLHGKKQKECYYKLSRAKIQSLLYLVKSLDIIFFTYG